MEADTQGNFGILGWNKRSWGNKLQGTSPDTYPATEGMKWDSLSASQLKAATALGFTALGWDNM